MMRHMKNTTTMICAVLMLFIAHTSFGQRVVTTNSVFAEGDYTYEFWMDAGGGTGSMTTGPNGTFSAEWNDVFNILFRSGIRPGSLNQVITYSVTYNPVGNSYLTLYGWTRNPLVEYYVVESWGTWRPPGATPIGTVTSDGGTYDIYRTERVNKPSIDGMQTFPQFWSVRQEKRTSGIITFANHISAWKNLGMNMGADLHEVSFCVEGFRSSGSAHVYSLTFTSGTKNASCQADGLNTHPLVSVSLNPGNNNILNFVFEEQPCNNAAINIYNSMGTLIQSVTNPEKMIQLDIAMLDSGIYNVEVISEEHHSKHLVVR